MLTLESGTVGVSQVSVTHIAPTKLSSATCWISSTLFLIALTFVVKIVIAIASRSYNLYCMSHYTYVEMFLSRVNFTLSSPEVLVLFLILSGCQNLQLTNLGQKPVPCTSVLSAVIRGSYTKNIFFFCTRLHYNLFFLCY